jgi:hypothetical protein
MYVGGGNDVYVYRLIGGRPTANRVRNLHVAFSVSSLAVGIDGRIFVGGNHEVAMYLPGARGIDRPRRMLSIQGSAYALAVDPEGHLYVGEGGYGIDVYPPGATGSTKPVVTIPDISRSGGITLDAAGNLYVADKIEGFVEYASPTTNPTVVRSICFPRHASPRGIALALDGSAYITVIHESPNAGHVTPITPGEGGCVPVQHRLNSIPPFYDPEGIVERDGLIYVTDSDFGVKGKAAVAVFDEHDLGHVHPLDVFEPPGMGSSIALGS